MANRINVVLGLDVSQFQRSISTVQGQLTRFASSLQNAGRTLTESLTAPILAGGVAAVAVAAKYETLQTSLSTLLGSAEKGAEAFKQLSQFAARTPFQLEDVAAGAKQLLAFGLNIDQVYDSLNFLGDIAGATGSNLQDLTLIFGQARSIGAAYTEDLRQLAERGVPVFDLLSEKTGLTGDALKKFIEQGKVTFPLLQSLLKSTAQEGGIFFGGMEAQSKTLAGVFSTFKDNVQLALAQIGNTIANAIDLRGVMNTLSQAVQAASEWFSNLSPGLQRFIVIAAGVAAALGPVLFIIGKMVAIWPILLAGVKAGAAAFTLLTGPIGLTVVAIAALVAGLVIAYKRSAEFRELVARVGMAIKQGFAQAVEIARAELMRLRAGFEAMRPQLQKAWEILQVLIKAWLGLQKVLYTIYANVLGAFLTVWTGVFSALRESASQFFDEFRANIKAFGTAFEELKKGNIKSALQGLAKELTNDGANMAEAFTTGFKRGFDGTRDFFAGIKKAFNADIPAAAAQAGEESGSAFAAPSGTTPFAPGGTGEADPKKRLADAIGGFQKLRQEIVTTQAAAASLGMAVIAPLKEFDDGTKAASAALQAFGTAFDLATASANVFGLSALETVKSQLSVVASELQKGIEVFGVNSLVVDTLRQKYGELSEQLLILQQQEAASIEMQQAIGSAIQQAGNIIAGAFSEGTITMKKFGQAVLQASGIIIGAFIREGVAGIVKNILAGPTGTLGPIAIGIAAAAGVAAQGLFSGLLNSISAPKFARGGMVTGETLAVVGDNPSGKEAIIPFERMGEFLNMAGGGQTRLTGLFEVRGSDLILVLDRAQQDQARVR